MARVQPVVNPNDGLQRRPRPAEPMVVRTHAWKLARTALLSLSLLPVSAAIDREPEAARAFREVGVASYMSAALAGNRTASGAVFDPTLLVAAHRTLPFGSRVRVLNLDNGRRATVTIVDRGPFRPGRIIDVSPRAARVLGFLEAGTARVRIEVIGRT